MVPTLQTERLYLVELTDKYMFQLYDMLAHHNDIYSGFQTFESTIQAMQFIEYSRKKYESGTGIRWGILEKETRQLIGTVGLDSIHKGNGRGDLGYYIDAKYRRKGYATEAIKKVIEICFEKEDFFRIGALIHPKNTGSRELIEKIGFFEEGILRKYINNEDYVLYSLLSTEYEERKQVIIQGENVTLRSKTLEDVPELYEYIYGDSHTEWKEWDAPYFEKQKLDYDTFFKQEKEKLLHKPTSLLIEVNNKVIGMVTFYWDCKETKWLECGIVIYKSEYWNGGFGTEALKLWISYLFASFDIPRVGITTWSGNIRMMKAANKLGMKLEGRMRHCRYYNGEYYDSIRMGILREEWNVFHK